jgi:hypothetical protein
MLSVATAARTGPFQSLVRFSCDQRPYPCCSGPSSGLHGSQLWDAANTSWWTRMWTSDKPSSRIVTSSGERGQLALMAATSAAGDGLRVSLGGCRHRSRAGLHGKRCQDDLRNGWDFGLNPRDPAIFSTTMRGSRRMLPAVFDRPFGRVGGDKSALDYRCNACKKSRVPYNRKCCIARWGWARDDGRRADG